MASSRLFHHNAFIPLYTYKYTFNVLTYANSFYPYFVLYTSPLKMNVSMGVFLKKWSFRSRIKCVRSGKVNKMQNTKKIGIMFFRRILNMRKKAILLPVILVAALFSGCTKPHYTPFKYDSESYKPQFQRADCRYCNCGIGCRRQ